METTAKKEYRTEKDSIGTRNIPEDVYYGVQTLRAAENFRITGLNMHPEIINSLAYIKNEIRGGIGSCIFQKSFNMLRIRAERGDRWHNNKAARD